MLRHAIDGFLSKIVSRKLLVWGTATSLLALQILVQVTGLQLAWFILAPQGAVDLAKAWKHG